MSGILLDDELTDDALTGDFRVYQRRRGHRYSLDDLLVASVALEMRPEASKVLDLGSGLGSVPLMIAHGNRSASIQCVEAQEVSFALLQKNIARNGLEERVRAMHADFRAMELGEQRFELITGTPPYFKVGEATLPPDSQKAHARFEIRGGVEAYLETAAVYLDEGGAVVLCAASSREEGALKRAEELGLSPRKIVEAIPREGRPPLFTVFAFERGAPAIQRERFIARTSEGKTSRAYLATRARFGLFDKEQQS